MESGLGKVSFAAVVALLLAGSTAHASLIGDTVEATLTAPDEAGDLNLFALPDLTFDPVSAEVGDGVEFVAALIENIGAAGDILLDIDAEEFWVTITNIVGEDLVLGADLTLVLSDLDWLPTPGVITEVVLLSAPADVFGEFSWTADSFTGTLFSDSIISADGTMLHFGIVTSHGDVVPEPATIALFGIGLAGLAARRVRKAA